MWHCVASSRAQEFGLAAFNGLDSNTSGLAVAQQCCHSLEWFASDMVSHQFCSQLPLAACPWPLGCASHNHAESSCHGSHLSVLHAQHWQRLVSKLHQTTPTTATSWTGWQQGGCGACEYHTCNQPAQSYNDCTNQRIRARQVTATSDTATNKQCHCHHCSAVAAVRQDTAGHVASLAPAANKPAVPRVTKPQCWQPPALNRRRPRAHAACCHQPGSINVSCV